MKKGSEHWSDNPKGVAADKASKSKGNAEKGHEAAMKQDSSKRKKSMAKSVKPKKVVKPKSKSSKPMTFEEKLSDTKARMNKIVEGDDQGYHLR